MEPFSLKEIRQQNLRRVYRLICGSHPISRSRIAAALGMSLPTVTQHLETLMESGLIRQDGFMASSIGRRAAAYVPCPSARAAVGAEILPPSADHSRRRSGRRNSRIRILPAGFSPR